MRKLIEKPHLIFLIAIPIIILFGNLSRESAIDINVHNTYFVIAYSHLASMVSILFSFFGIGYWFMKKTNRKLLKLLTQIHISVTLGGLITIMILTQFYRQEIMEYEFNNNLTLAKMLLVMLMVFGQIIFPINIIYGLIKRTK